MTGKYENGKIRLPEIPEVQDGRYIVTRGKEGDVTLYTIEQWNTFLQEIERCGKYRGMLSAFYVSCAYDAEVENSSFEIPEFLAEHAGLRENVDVKVCERYISIKNID